MYYKYVYLLYMFSTPWGLFVIRQMQQRSTQLGLLCFTDDESYFLL